VGLGFVEHFIGDADERLREDYLRILRFFRFNAWYGAGIDNAGLAACMRQKAGLRRIAAERIWKELHKLLSAEDPCVVVRAMEETGVLAEVIPNAVPVDRLEATVPLINAAGVLPDAIRRVMALITPTDSAVGSLAKALRLSNADKARLENWVVARRAMSAEMLPQNELFREFYRHGTEAVLDYSLWRNLGRDGLSPFEITSLF